MSSRSRSRSPVVQDDENVEEDEKAQDAGKEIPLPDTEKDDEESEEANKVAEETATGSAAIVKI